jgi:adenylate cyclase
MNNKLYRVDDFVLDTQRRCFFYENHPVQLSSRAFEILHYLIERRGEIVEKEDLLQRVWTDSFVEEGNLAVHISALRRVLQEKKGESKYIRTIPGRGYSFIASVTEVSSLQEKKLLESESLLLEEGFSKEEEISIAVLPFTFEGGEKDNEYLADGVTRSLINDLSQISNLKVLAHSAVKKYKGSELELQEIGFLLDANKILTGHISQFKGKLEIVVELINAGDKRCIWGASQFFDAKDIFNVKNEISLTIAKKLKLKLKLAEESKITGQKEISAEAQKLYFRGKFILESRTSKKQPEEILNQALKFFRDAVKKEPNYALPYVGIGSVYVSLHNHNLLEREKAYSEAKHALQMLFHINDKLSEAYVLKGSIEIMFEMNFAEATKSLDRAIELNSNNPDAHHWKSYICICLRKYEEAFRLESKATELDPTSIRFNESLTRIFYCSGDYKKAIIYAEEMLEFDEKTLTAHFFLALSYARLGFFEIALEYIEKAIKIRRSSEILIHKAFIYALSGDSSTAEEILEKAMKEFDSQIDFTDVALVYTALGKFEQAIEILYKAYHKKSTNLNLVNADDRFKSLRGDERFEELLRKMHLV